MEEPPPPPRLTRQNAVVLDNTVTLFGQQYQVNRVDGIEFIIINGELYNVRTDANGRYIMLPNGADGFVQPVSGGRKSRRRKSRKRSRRTIL
jgi:hypothetical protein